MLDRAQRQRASSFGALALVLALVLGAVAFQLRPHGPWLARALGKTDARASLVRTPADGVHAAVGASGLAVSTRHEHVYLSSVGLHGHPWQRHANGLTRATSFGSDALVVTAHGSEQFLTVERRLGYRLWRWRLRAPMTPLLNPDGSVVIGSFLKIEPLRILTPKGQDVTPRGAHWRLARVNGQWELELPLDDTLLPAPYVIDPAIDYNGATNTTSWYLTSTNGTLTTDGTNPTSDAQLQAGGTPPSVENAAATIGARPAGSTIVAADDGTGPATTPTNNGASGVAWGSTTTGSFPWTIAGNTNGGGGTCASCTYDRGTTTAGALTMKWASGYGSGATEASLPTMTNTVNADAVMMFSSNTLASTVGKTLETGIRLRRVTASQYYQCQVNINSVTNAITASAFVDNNGGVHSIGTTALGAASASQGTFSIAAGVDYKVRCQVVTVVSPLGVSRTHVRVKVWQADGTGFVAEPSAWAIDQVDTTVAAPDLLSPATSTASVFTAISALGATTVPTWTLDNIAIHAVRAPAYWVLSPTGTTADANGVATVPTAPVTGSGGATAATAGKGWFIDAGASNGATAFPAGNFSLTLKTQVPVAAPNIRAVLTLALYKVTVAGGTLACVGTCTASGTGAGTGATILAPTDDPNATGAGECGLNAADICTGTAGNVFTSGGSPVTTTTGTFAVPAFKLAAGQTVFAQVFVHYLDGAADTTAADSALDAFVNQGTSLIAHPLADDTAPAATISFPTASAYNTTGWGSGSIAGTATDAAGNGVASTKVSIQKDGGANSCWDGTDLAGHFTTACPNYVAVTNGTASGGATANWSTTLSAGSLVNGSAYAISVQTTDTPGNVNNTAATATFTYDTSAPATATLTTNGIYNAAGLPASLTGTTTDSGTGGHGISAVNISIQDSTSGKCWNGTNFTTATCPNYVAVTSGGTAAGTANANWSYATAGLAAQLASGDTYTVQIQATDATTSGNTSGNLAAGTFVYDNLAPNTASLTTNGAYNAAGLPASLTGTTTDAGTGGNGISAVNISIQDSTSGKCWNGTNFTTATCPNYVAVTSGGTASGTANANWSYSTTGLAGQLASGDTYTVQIQATDATTSGNTSGNLAAGTFVYDTAAPSTATLTSNGAYNAAGLPASLTGTTTDSGTGGHGISAVNISIQDSTSGKCWNGTNFTTATCPNYVAVT
ncbi:MAG: beta strand repeat-containing protein, partial [Gaiellaceae bacterium]